MSNRKAWRSDVESSPTRETRRELRARNGVARNKPVWARSHATDNRKGYRHNG